MKKFTFLLLLLSSFSYGQHKVSEKIAHMNDRHVTFTRFTPLQASKGPANAAINAAVKNATLAQLNKNFVKQLTVSAPDAIELTLPYNGTNVVLQLYKADIMAQGFHADTDKLKNFNYHPGVYYRGIIKGDENSLASFSFFNNEMSGVASSASLKNLVVGHLPQERDASQYVIYSDANLNLANNFACTTAEDILPQNGKKGVNAVTDTETNNCATVYFELDHDIYLQNGSNEQAAGDWLTALFNNTQTLYENDGISVSLKSFMVWTSPDQYVGPEAEDYLNEFAINHFEQDFDGDVGQLLAMDPGGLGGLAVLGGLCQNSSGINVSYVDINDLDFSPVPLYSWTVQAVTHELGHLFGSQHTHACAWNGNDTPIDGCAPVEDGVCSPGPIPQEGGTIMSYCHLQPVGVNLANGFGPQPAQRIQDFINNATCLGSFCAATACHSYISAVNTTSITNDTAGFSWADETTGPWQVAIYAQNEEPTWQNATAPSVTFEGLQPNTYYTFGIRTVCDSGTSAIEEVLFATGAEWCSGQVFTGPNGISGFYQSNQHVIRTLTPSAPNNRIKVTFSSFHLEDGYDFLKVYDGADTNAPLIGQYTGNTAPGSFVSTAENGALTFEFTSDIQVNSLGWVANVTCESTLGTDAGSFINLQYFPNPASTAVTLVSEEPVEEITVYNTTGQILLQQKVNATRFVADISSFATGVYFFKVTGSNKLANFNIIKQ